MNVNDITTMYSGESKNFVVTVYDENNKELNLTGASFNWMLDVRSNPIRKDSSLGDIVVTNATIGEVTVFLKPDDTKYLNGIFYQELKMTDQNGNESVVYYDVLRIKPSLI